MRYGLTLVTAPTVEPVSTAEAVNQVRVAAEGGAYDTELNRLIKAATREVERLTSRQIINATYDLKLDTFPYGSFGTDRYGYGGIIYIPKAPFNTLTASDTYPGLGITYYDATGALQTLSTSVYKVITSREPGEIHLKMGQAWPTVYAESEVVTVRFLAGYGATSTAVPEGIRQAILLMVDDWFEKRMGEGEIGPRIRDLLASHCVGDEFTQYGEQCHAYAI